MKAYIKSTSVISPQKTFGIQGFPQEVTDYPVAGFLKCVEPPYKDFLDPMISRRMSRIVKMAVCAALSCLRGAGIGMPDGIIAGTGLGCLEDTEKFLCSIYDNNERLMNPTPFIQSTHNTVAGAIALAIKCHGYNATYAHRGFSFESAILDALLQVTDNPGLNLLVGGFDELTDSSYVITKRMGLWKRKPISSISLLEQNGKGTLPGEGLGFFMLSGIRSENDLARLVSVRAMFQPAEARQTENEVNAFIANAGLSITDIDLALLGINGDSPTDKYYHDLMAGILSKVPKAGFKHLCGEYDTSSSFALWLASVVLHDQSIPDCILIGKRKPGKINHVLIYNHLRGVNHFMYLLSSC